MLAGQAKMLDFLKKSQQLMVPIYQRTYSWTERECRQLWDDIIRTGNDDKVSSHFVGSIVYIEKGLYQVTGHSPLLVIDGQQRLTTMTLLLEALARAVADKEPLDGFSATKIRGYYLLNNLESGPLKYKLVLTQTDETSLKAIVDQLELPKEYSLQVSSNFELFKSWIAELNGDFVPLCKGLAKLIIVDISLSRDQDNPQLIFESLNSTGRELSQADLIRNFILMDLEPDLQNRLYLKLWRPMEIEFGQKAYAAQFDGFMRHYLTVKTGKIPNVGEVYDAFKEYAGSQQEMAVESLVSDIRVFAHYFCALTLQAEEDPDLKSVFQEIRELRVDVAYPFMLQLYDDYKHELLKKDEFVSAARLIESYAFRRAVCSIPSNSMNKTFANFSRNLKKDRYLESIQAYFLNLPSYRRFPRDEEFEQQLVIKDLYNFRNRSYWLRRFENYDRKEPVPVNEYTIEHIMPQKEDVSLAWRNDLGADWMRIHKEYLDTLGNLTLTGYNSEYSYKPFTEKRDMEGGFAESPLRLNQGLGKLEHWNEQSIKERADRLASQAMKVWPAPKLDQNILDTYKSKAVATSYTVSDHPHLASGPMHDLYLEFRKQVLALDPCVMEEFMKLYVAYKAETNFVDIIPQSKRLLLVLNMPFPSINDPKSICRDITGLGRRGNGDVEVPLSSIQELPYVMGLVRQSFERQMGTNTENNQD